MGTLLKPRCVSTPLKLETVRLCYQQTIQFFKLFFLSKHRISSKLGSFSFIGQFIFSIWDEDRWSGSGENKKPKASKKLTWPLYMRNCRRNCQDCGMQHLKPWQQKGLTTGTKCIMSYPKMKVKYSF